ncbi:hypothetical protein B0H11DRAFT_1912644 [Mycena galericulata]|nr:hypothetical protein B0H11DRAFT_1912644 [Mycena galericulata]
MTTTNSAMDVDDSEALSEGWGPAGLCESGTNRSLKYFYDDASIYIRLHGSRVIYGVWGSRLARFSVFFKDLQALPLVSAIHHKTESDPPAIENATENPKPEVSGDGKSEKTPLFIQATEEAFEVFLECIFLEVGQDVLRTRPVIFWEHALEMADFLNSSVVTKTAIHWLGQRKDFEPVLRLQLAIRYGIKDWFDSAFRRLIQTPISSLTSDGIDMIGFDAFVILAATQSKITSHRTLCALSVPPVEHGSSCNDSIACNRSWAHAWWGEATKHGVAVALIHPNHLPIQKIIHALPNLITSWHMSEDCRSQTIRSLKGPSSPLLKEETMIQAAIEQLKTL